MAIQSLTYIKSRFEKGDLPDQNDFHDLIDSCFNYSLSDSPDYISFISSASGNWQFAYDIVDEKRYDWDEAYSIGTQYRAVSGSYATISQINQINSQNNNTFFKLSGGLISGDLSVQGTILSGGSNIFGLFKKTNEFQRLNYNENSYELSLTDSNFVTLSSLRSVNNLRFLHNAFNPVSNRTYIFGQLNIQPLTSINFSNCIRSFYKGSIKELILQNSYTPGTSETSSFFLVNRTQNLTASLVSSIRYSDTLAVETTNLTNTLLNGLPNNPEPWVANGVTFNGTNGAVFANSLANLTTSRIINSTKYQRLSVFATGNAEPAGINIGVILQYTQDGSNYSFALGNQINSTRAATTTDTLLNWGEIIIPGGISSDFRLRLLVSGQVWVKNFNVFGYFPVDTRLEYVSLNTPMNVNVGDLLDVRFTTGNFISPPTNVVNFVDAKLDITG